MVLSLFACPILAFAQPDEPPKKEPSPPAAAGPKSPVGPAAPKGSELDTFLLRDSKGNLVPVLGMTFEDFEKLLKLKQGLAPAQPPAYVLDGLSITGSVQNQLANLEVTASIRIRDEGWVRVPLKMNKGVLLDIPKYTGSGEQFTTFDATEGYQCWLKGADAKPHVVRMTIVYPIHESGTQSRLEVLLPRATESSLKLQVPFEKAEGFLKAGNEGIVSSKSSGGGKSDLEVIGPGGDLQLTWQPAAEISAEARQLLDASGEVTVRIESRNRIGSDARLKVRSFGSPVETFRVRLPAGMEWVPTNPTGYSVIPVTAAGGERAQELEVKLDRPSSGITEVRLLASLAPGAESAGGALQPARFEVLGAVRQRGVIDFVIDGDWSLEWTEDASTRRVDVPAEAAASSKSIARFEYFRQPCGLQLKVAARPTRLVIEPSYLIFVEPQLVRLEATLRCRVRGARPARLTVALGDWQLDRAGPEALVEQELVDGVQKPLSLPLKAGPTGEMELKLELHKEIAAGSSRFAFDLPRPVADLLDPASVVVLAADNVEIAPRIRELSGLTTDALPSGIKLPERQQQPLVFRDLGYAGSSHFSADFQVRTRQVTVDAAARLQFSPRAVTVEQRLRYRILYEPQRTFTLLVPETLAARGEIKVLLGNQALLLAPAPAISSASGPSLARYQITAPQELRGNVELLVQYSVPLPALENEKPTELAVPLVIPAEDEVQSTSGQSLAVTWGDTLDVELAAFSSAGFQLVTSTGSATELQYSSARLLPSARWKLSPADQSAGRTVSVSRVWLQSLINDQGRRDRTAWKLRTTAHELAIRFPTGTDMESVELALDGARLGVVRIDKESAYFTLKADSAQRERVLEAWFAVRGGEPLGEILQNRVAAPQLLGVSHIREAYWQLCLPADRHLLGDPPGFIPEMQYSWRNWFWDRRGAMRQEELEDWVGATHQQAIPQQTNQYLFSSFGSFENIPLFAVSRRLILGMAGAVILGLGLLLLHIPTLRHPATALFIAVAIGAASLTWPAAGLLLAQGSTLALGVVGLAMLWQWGISGRPAWPTPKVVRETPSTRDRPSTVATSPHIEVPPPASTTTAPLIGAGEVRT
ncbi:MAG: hypothetical protein K8R36_05965 [Planctomycetales bacterium]|nr:hypothetical protein [Planctomycetales bacterium]